MIISSAELIGVASVAGAAVGALVTYARAQGKKDREHSEIMGALFGSEGREGMCKRFERVCAKLENGLIRRVETIEQETSNNARALVELKYSQKSTADSLEELHSGQKELASKIDKLHA